jgi:hypothetical protein
LVPATEVEIPLLYADFQGWFYVKWEALPCRASLVVEVSDDDNHRDEEDREEIVVWKIQLIGQRDCDRGDGREVHGSVCLRYLSGMTILLDRREFVLWIGIQVDLIGEVDMKNRHGEDQLVEMEKWSNLDDMKME